MSRITRLLKSGHDWRIKPVTDQFYREFDLAVCEKCWIETPDWEDEPPCRGLAQQPFDYERDA